MAAQLHRTERQGRSRSRSRSANRGRANRLRSRSANRNNQRRTRNSIEPRTPELLILNMKIADLKHQLEKATNEKKHLAALQYQHRRDAIFTLSQHAHHRMRDKFSNALGKQRELADDLEQALEEKRKRLAKIKRGSPNTCNGPGCSFMG